MDALAFLLVSLPIFYPLVMEMGYDPIWFGQVITIVTTMGAIMPPDRDLLLRRRRDGQGHPPGHGLPGGHVLHPVLHHDAHHPDALPLRDGADAVEPRPLTPALSFCLHFREAVLEGRNVHGSSAPTP